MAYNSYFWWNNSAIGVGAQQAKPATDRAALEKALTWWSGRDNEGPHTRVIMDAARKHLETLPKPLWRVTATLSSGDPAAPYIATSHKEALDFASSYLADGNTHVSVREMRS